MSNRKSISKKRRFDVFKRDGFVCQYCGGHPPKVLLHVDHINPVALGGTNDIDNLITACEVCNQGKGARPLDAVPQSLEVRSREVEEREAQIAGYARVMEARRERLENDVWRVAEALRLGAADGYPHNRFNGIKTFVDALGVHQVLDSVDIAQAKFSYSETKAFKYFCGICWNRIREQTHGED